MNLDSRECRCLQTCSELPGSLQRSLKPLSISSLKSHITGTGRIFVRRQSLKGLRSRQKCCRSWQFYCIVLRFNLVILFLKLCLVFSVPERNYFFSAAFETWCWISLGMFMSWVKDCICERELNISLVRMSWLLFDTFLIRWCESLQPVILVTASLWHPGYCQILIWM